jgi:hypothetical protein
MPLLAMIHESQAEAVQDLRCRLKAAPLSDVEDRVVHSRRE